MTVGSSTLGIYTWKQYNAVSYHCAKHNKA